MRIQWMIKIITSLVCMISIVSLAWGQTIKIGVASPYSGDLASYGVPVKNAVEIAVKKVNAIGGIDGKRVELLAEDDVCGPDTAVNVAKKLVDAGVHAVVGHLCSGATEAALAVYRNAKIPIISPASTNPSLTLAGKNPNFFRTIAHDAAQAELQVAFAVDQLNIKSAAVIHDKGAYGKGLADLVHQGLKERGIEVAMFEGITPGAPDYSAVISKMKKNKITRKNTAVFFGGYHPEASKIVTAARKKRSNAKFISGDGVKDPSFLKITGRYALDYYVSAPVDTSSVGMNQLVSSEYKEEYGTDPGTFSLQGYAAFLALVNAIDKANSTDYNSVIKALQSEKVDTPIGTISFDENGDVIGAGFSMYSVQPSFLPVQ